MFQYKLEYITSWDSGESFIQCKQKNLHTDIIRIEPITLWLRGVCLALGRSGPTSEVLMK
jgi:hypothetical protein